MNPDHLDRAVRLAVYQVFVQTGHAPDTASLAVGLDQPVSEVVNAIRRLADARVLVLRPGSDSIWMAMPFSAVPTGFRVLTSEGGAWWGNCAWDALGIPAALQIDAEIEATCAMDGAPLRLSVAEGRVHGRAFVHFAVPAAHWWDDIGFT